MNHQTTNESNPRLAVLLGFWVSVAEIVLTIGYMVALMVLLLFYQKVQFTTMEAYAADFSSSQETVYTFVQIVAVLPALLVPAWFAAIHQVVPIERRVFTLTGLMFALAFTVLVSICYFVQLVVVRQNIIAGNLQGLEWFVEWNLLSVMFAINILGWFVFLGLAHLFIAPVFYIGKLARWMRALLIITGIAELLGGIVFVLGQITWLAPFVMVQSIGFLVVLILSAVYFRGIDRL